jgi:hypothetical protein
MKNVLLSLALFLTACAHTNFDVKDQHCYSRDEINNIIGQPNQWKITDVEILAVIGDRNEVFEKYIPINGQPFETLDLFLTIYYKNNVIESSKITRFVLKYATGKVETYQLHQETQHILNAKNQKEDVVFDTRCYDKR